MAAISVAAAQLPPVPDHFWPYGQVLLGGENIEPDEQLVIALVDGMACGFAETFIAEADPDTPADDVGRTVYVITVRADGTGPGQAPGCGVDGVPVSFWFPEAGRFANEQPLFHQGEARVDLSLGPGLGTRIPVPFVSDDGPQE